MDGAGEGKAPLAVTVGWLLPGLTRRSPLKPMPVVRYSIEPETSISSVTKAVEDAKGGVNKILTHIVETGNWPHTLPTAVLPECAHGYSYTEQECHYSPSHWTESGRQPNVVTARYVQKMLAYSPTDLQQKYGGQLDVPYSDGGTDTKMDIYGSDVLPVAAPVFAFVHGGYWTEGSRKQAAVMAPNMFSKGVVTAIIGYDLAPTVSLAEMVQEISTALNFLDDWCSRRGSRGLYLCGHSAGAHLVAMAAMTNGAEKMKNLKGLFLLSGVYDLIPLIGTYIDRPLGLTEETAVRSSPTHQIRHLSDTCRQFLSNVEIHVVVEEYDSSAFLVQSRSFYDLLKSEKLCADNDSHFHSIEKMDHFTLIEHLDDPNYCLFKCLCDWMSVM